ncbi:preprotein translocase subunit SecE [Alkalilimnicola sp. S0819]|uniref:preprotein translocase subunit SecE n=1 Tax=Alkalilimnicola sp. S0819 TaxID=2613922 RepID=UPI00126216F4|nr:preprotein translocase subunit SecE [Alkalilimnicola sp. S0819]KAB7622870.1 preprotein translocase subunit SecE [Alkalilimnicola sp. S0819]MPQ17192.1 preprotein translocase subunit SecE [Alkalilimnicola sp. S0819]
MVAEKSPLDAAKLIFALALVAAGVVGFYYYEDQSQLYRVLGLLVVVAMAAAVAMTTWLGRNVWASGKASYNEVRRVIWPTRQETLQTTLVVMVVVLIVAIFLWLVDSLSLWVVRWLTGLGG